ncbi:hypothetical protein [Azospirillum picis]|uniref:Lysozyme inhibitor LprI N-terminal domain-containing protein n=1 Tax=Azospirillum picis TaxID=488438 RepID=A0ABU0MTF0_9PROT|nr:hypothetical protein [Azospirillum picis]MBP2302985.1 hypothetical protein [Azospirillum picis]MDQ0536737.1 hypothetical protein [Azospirillum picis]
MTAAMPPGTRTGDRPPRHRAPRHRCRRVLLPALALGLGTLALAGTAQAAGGCAGKPTRVEQMICTDPDVSALDGELKALFDRIEDETNGIDGETGQVSDPFGADHARWREQVRDACRDTACLKRVYTARIAEVRRTWSQALSDAPPSQQPASSRHPGSRHYVNVRFGFSVDVPGDLVAEPPPDNGDGQAYHSADGSLHLTVSGLIDAAEEGLKSFVASDQKACLRQPPEYLVRKPDWIVFSCTTATGLLYQKTLLQGGRGGAFISLRIRYPASEQARWNAAVAMASKSLRLTGASDPK